MTQFPAYRRSPYYETIKNDRDLSVFYEIVSHAKHVRTLIPVQGYLMELLKRGTDHVLYDGDEPKAVLDEVTRESQERLNQVLADVERRRKLDVH